MKPKSASYQKALRDRRKSEGLKTLIRYVRPEWIPEIDQLIKELEKSLSSLTSLR